MTDSVARYVLLRFLLGKLNPLILLKIPQIFYSWSQCDYNAWLCGSMFCVYVCADALHPRQQFFSHVGMYESAVALSLIDLRPRGRGFKSHRGHYVVSLNKTHYS